MNKSLKYACTAGMAAVLALIFLIGIAGCEKKDSAVGPLGSPYTVDYKITPHNWQDPYSSQHGSWTGIDVTIKEPAATELSIILIDPNKQEFPFGSIVKGRIAKDVIWQVHDPLPGTWVLAVKALKPEKIVWQKEVTLLSDSSSGKPISQDSPQNTAYTP